MVRLRSASPVESDRERRRVCYRGLCFLQTRGRHGWKRTGGFGCAMSHGDADTHRGDPGPDDSRATPLRQCAIMMCTDAPVAAGLVARARNQPWEEQTP